MTVNCPASPVDRRPVDRRAVDRRAVDRSPARSATMRVLPGRGEVRMCGRRRLTEDQTCGLRRDLRTRTAPWLRGSVARTTGIPSSRRSIGASNTMKYQVPCRGFQDPSARRSLARRTPNSLPSCTQKAAHVCRQPSSGQVGVLSCMAMHAAVANRGVPPTSRRLVVELDKRPVPAERLAQGHQDHALERERLRREPAHGAS